MLQIIKINFLKQACFVAVVIFSSGMANAATYTVINTVNSGAGSMRQAILDANANPGLDSIHFNIPGGCPQTINPLTRLPDITSPVEINGYTQSGAAVATASSAATLCVEISGEMVPAPFGGSGLLLAAGSSGSSIRGLVINRFKRHVPSGVGGIAIVMFGSGSNWIAGNYLNTDAAGTATFFSSGFSSVGTGITDAGSGGNIFGHDPLGPNSLNPAADRNIISGSGSGLVGFVVVPTSSANEIRGNYVGTDVSGTLDLGSATHGIVLQSSNNLIEDNLISGNTNIGLVLLTGGGNWIENNKFGTDVTGTLNLGNGLGISLISSHNTVINNTVAFNNLAGVFVNPITSSVSNSILSNSIFENLGLGIDLHNGPCNPGNCPGIGLPSLNDVLDVDMSANNLQNFPVIDGKRSFLNPALVQVWGSLDSKASQDYLIQVFSNDLADPSGYGEGKALVGEMTVTTDASGHADFHLPAMLGVPAGSIITATATDSLTMDTSEFSKWENVDAKGSPTAYENAAGAAGGDGLGSMDWEPNIE